MNRHFILTAVRGVSRTATAILLLLLLPFPAQTQKGERPLVRASLLAASADPSAPFDVGIRLRIAPGWHLYWKNPGDAGLPVDVAWKLPGGLRVTDIRYPVPKKKLIDDAVCYVYEREVILLCRIEPLTMRSRRDTVTLGARLDWLVCKESCLRGGTDISLDLVSRDVRELDRQRRMIEEAGRKLPEPLEKGGLRVDHALLRESGKQGFIEIAFGGRGSQAIRDFYPENLEQFTIQYADISVSRNIVRIPVTPSSLHARLDRIAGLVTVGGKTYDVNVDVHSGSR
jgi:DsbC/DsbD-like thiol-disulfide interchange protein